MDAPNDPSTGTDSEHPNVSPASVGLRRLALCVPVFDDGEAVDLVLDQLSDTLERRDRTVEALLPDACSLSPAPAELGRVRAGLDRVAVLRLRRNLGHQRAIAVGLTPPGTRLVALRYLDSAGLFASLANKLLLRTALPSRRPVQAWDRFLVPTSRHLDRRLGVRAGKSVLAVWQRVGGPRQAQ